jgi:FMN-dependent oxidoreductase (nitrilotriacetate monooxygenase family)
MTSRKSMILCGAVMHGTGMHLGSWLSRDGDPMDYVSPELFAAVARTAEEAKLHSVFFADGITNNESGTDRPTGALDPVMLLMHMANHSTHLGLAATASTTYNEPYNVARKFGTLDHLSHGRAGWNVVATFNPEVAKAYGRELPDHAGRYARQEEFVDVVMQLWDSWEDDAFIGDKETNRFADPDKVHEIDFDGEYYQVKGTTPFPRTPQGRPVIFQAGASPEGRALAARTADVVFTAQHQMSGAIEYRTDIRARAEAFGRDPDSIKVLPGMFVTLGATQEEADARRGRMDELLGTEPELVKLALRVGLPKHVLKLDEKFPADLLCPDEEFSGSVGFRRSIVNMAVSEDLTVRELLVRYGGGHHQVVGTPEKIADIMETWLDAGAADGFNIMVDELPSGFERIRDLLVPELQRRGMFHEDYEGTTLRESLGLPYPAVKVPVAV